MQNSNNLPANANEDQQQRQAAIEVLVAQTVEEKMRARELFTAIDISNQLKRQRFPVRHSEAAGLVREIWSSGAMRAAGYERRLIDVYTGGGTEEAQAFLYLPAGSDPNDYAERIQEALPPVSSDIARDLLDAVPSHDPNSPLLVG